MPYYRIIKKIRRLHAQIKPAKFFILIFLPFIISYIIRSIKYGSDTGRMIMNNIKFILLLSVFLLTLMQITGDTASSRFLLNDAYPPGFYKDDPLPDKTAYLTFDDGPSEWTADILDTLREEGIRATFFICAERFPQSDIVNNSFAEFKDVLNRMIREGHVIGNHTASHRDLATLSPEHIEQQLDENQYILNRELGLTAPHMTLIRPPYGSPWYSRASDIIRAKVGNKIKSRGLLIMWSRFSDSGDSVDWISGDWYRESPRVNVNNAEFHKRMYEIYRRVINHADGLGIVILFHDTHLTTKTVLPKIIKKLKGMGYTFGTIEDYVKWRWGKNSSVVLSKKLPELQN